MIPGPDRAARSARWVIRNEGNYSDHALDRGGATRYGVTEATAARYNINLRTMTQADAERVFTSPEYWRWNQIRSDEVAAKLLDIAVNMGPTTAVRLLQRTLITLGHLIAEDGILGPITRQKANEERPFILLAALSVIQANRYLDIVRGDESQRVFLGGWLVRAVKPVDL